MMKILHIAPSYYPAFSFGGPIFSVHLLNAQLVKEGARVDVLTTNAGLRDQGGPTLNKWHLLDGLRVKYLPFWGYEHYNFSPSFFAESLRLVGGYDLVHMTAVWNFPLLAASLAACFYRRPYVISPRGTLYRETIELKSTRAKKLYYHCFARHYLRRARALHFTTEDEAQKVRSYLGLDREALLVPNGIDLSHFDPLPSRKIFTEKHPFLKKKKYLLFLGRIHRKKGLDLTLEAFRNLASRWKDLFLVIAGPDNVGYGRELKEWIRVKDLEKRVYFPGSLRGREKLAAYRGAEIFLLPSYSENFGMTVIEAMACETPVIISNQVGIYPRVKAEGAGVVIEASSKALEKAVEGLLQNRKQKAEFSQKGRATVEKYFSIGRVAREMKKHYQRLINDSRSNK